MRAPVRERLPLILLVFFTRYGYCEKHLKKFGCWRLYYLNINDKKLSVSKGCQWRKVRGCDSIIMHYFFLSSLLRSRRLQNSPYFCVFKYVRAVKQKVWNEAIVLKSNAAVFVSIFTLTSRNATKKKKKKKKPGKWILPLYFSSCPLWIVSLSRLSRTHEWNSEKNWARVYIWGAVNPDNINWQSFVDFR